jgi:RNA polymerase sigma factor (sigma-70 family)
VSPAPGPASPPGPGDSRLEVISQAYLAHAEAVRRHAARTTFGDYQAAEDATHEAFMEALRKWPRFRQVPSGQQLAWLCGRARWRVIDSWRASNAEHPADVLPDQFDAQDGEDTVLAGITTDRFWKVITTVVPRRAARAAYLKWHEDWTMTGIAKHLGIDRATVLRDINAVLDAARQLGEETGLPAGSKGGVA